MRTFREAKQMARALRAELRERRQVEFTHSECLEVVARQFGFDNWNILAARIEKESDSRVVQRFLLDGLDIGDPRRATSTTIPVLRIGDEKRALAYYCDFLGFTLDFGGPVGTVFARQAQVRWTQPFAGGQWSVALENPATVAASARGGLRTTTGSPGSPAPVTGCSRRPR